MVRFSVLSILLAQTAAPASDADVTQPPTPPSKRTVQSFVVKDKVLTEIWAEFEKSLRLSIGFESWSDPQQKPPMEEVVARLTTKHSPEFKNTTVGAVLDALVKLGGNEHVWVERGEWINLIPAVKRDDPDYWLNRRLNGQITVSAEGVTSSEGAIQVPPADVRLLTSFGGITSVSRAKAMADVVAGRRKSVPPEFALRTRPGAIVLENPTFREFFNARAHIYCQGGWSIKTTPTADDGRGHTATATMSYSGPLPARTPPSSGQ